MNIKISVTPSPGDRNVDPRRSRGWGEIMCYPRRRDYGTKAERISGALNIKDHFY
jgi:hypothetical protein